MTAEESRSRNKRGIGSNHHQHVPRTLHVHVPNLHQRMREVEMGVSNFMGSRRHRAEKLGAEISLQIQILTPILQAQGNQAERNAATFWSSLDRVYGAEGNYTSNSLVTLLDAWQDYISRRLYQDEKTKLIEIGQWLDELEGSCIDLHALTRGVSFFATDRVRDAQKRFIKLQQDTAAQQKKEEFDTKSISQESLLYPSSRLRYSTQPIHIPSFVNHWTPPRGIPLGGNIQDNWRFPKDV